MDLEIKNLYLDEGAGQQFPGDLYDFNVALGVEIGEKGKQGTELFHFVATSPRSLEDEINEGEFKLLRGYILVEKFDLKVIHRAIENLINHARSRQTWSEVTSFFSRYGIYDSEDLDGKHF